MACYYYLHMQMAYHQELQMMLNQLTNQDTPATQQYTTSRLDALLSLDEVLFSLLICGP